MAEPRLAVVITVSDSASRGERQDVSGPLACRRLREAGLEVAGPVVVADERALVAAAIREAAGRAQLVVTTGGTGLGPRDVTPEATTPILDKLVPGIAEAMRMETFGKTPTAILSRAVAGVRKKCLIVNMPGNPGGVRECMEVILPALVHAVEIITGTVTEHTEAHNN